MPALQMWYKNGIATEQEFHLLTTRCCEWECGLLSIEKKKYLYIPISYQKEVRIYQVSQLHTVWSSSQINSLLRTFGKKTL